jgi:hypothetical protein
MVTQFIDGVWTLAILRADAAGKELARVSSRIMYHMTCQDHSLLGGLFWQALVARRQTGDKRGITLVGYSVGARVVFSCLKELAILRYGDVGKKKSGNKQAASSSLSEVYGLFGLELLSFSHSTDVRCAGRGRHGRF